jgi:HlyD family secretion protein
MVAALNTAKAWYRGHRRTAVVLSLLVVAVLVLGAFRLGGGSGVRYFSAAVGRGDVVATVEATGTINAVTTVQVGSQVSGQVSALYADFNTQATRGSLLARIDAAPFEARVLQAEADLASAEAGVKSLQADLLVARANLGKARAALHEAELNRTRTRGLVEQGIASVQQEDAMEVAYETAVANVQAAEAQIGQTDARLEQGRAAVKQRQAALEQARFDLDRTYIRAPVDGIVIARNVDVGQTVAASLQAPTLFTIAQDLTQMLVYAKTDESDVGRIRVGGEASFKVDSFPDQTFHGRVTQVRMNAYQVENVVTYDTIIEFENPEKKLLPGMTAYVTIPTASAFDVIKIPNGAMRFTPEMPAEKRRALLVQHGINVPGAEGQRRSRTATAGNRQGRGRTANGPRLSRQRGAQAEDETDGPRRGPRPESAGGNAWKIVWKLNPDGSLQPLRIKAGVTDFTFTAVLEGELEPGDQLVIGQTVERRPSAFGRMMRRF